MANHRGRPPKNASTQREDMTTEQEDVNRSRFDFNKEPERAAREVDERVRDNYDEFPDLDNFNYSASAMRKLQLLAPPPRIHEKWGKMRQRWVACKHNNGRRVHDLIELGYQIRRPNTVPAGFRNFTEQWQSEDVIMVANECVLMETPEIHYLRLQQEKHKANKATIREIGHKHGSIMRDGELTDRVDQTAGNFATERVVQRNQGDGDISFAQ